MAATRILVALAVAQGFQSKPRLQPRKLSALKSVAEKANYAVVGCGLCAPASQRSNAGYPSLN